MPPKLIHINLLIGFGNKKAELDMQAMHDVDAHPLPCKKHFPWLKL
jgi:hypothetical protein